MHTSISLSLTLALAAIGQGQVDRVKPGFKFTSKPFVAGSVRLSPAQLRNWQTIVNATKPKPSGTMIYATGSELNHSFPDGYFNKTIFASPVKNVPFFVRADGLGAGEHTFQVQLSKEATSLSVTPPYVEWNKPKGFVSSYEIKIKMETGKSGVAEAPLCPTADFGSVKVTQNAPLGQFSLPLPNALLNTTGTVFYLRVVPISHSGSAVKAIGAPSNWEQFVVSDREDDYQQHYADQQAAQAAAKAKADAEKKAQELKNKIAAVRSAITQNYEIRLLSYIPPKFTDDSVATDYFLANRLVDLTYGTKATSVAPGETYSLNALHNILNSNKTWSQDLWDLLSAELNLLGSGYKDAKNLAINTLADGLQLIPGVKMGPAERAAMMTILDLALTYCGIPPEIPNIDQLYSRGLDYMASTLADMALEQATGVAIENLNVSPDDAKTMREQARGVARNAVKGMIATITKPSPFVADSPESWGYPAPFFRRHPAMLYLEVRRKAGGSDVDGQSWQNLEVGFDGEFYSIPKVLLPRKIDDRIRIPIALTTTLGPDAWHIKGMMPEKYVDPASEVGQPYYGDRGWTKISMTTYHRLAGTGTVFPVTWPGESVSTGYVNGRLIPDGASPPKAKLDAALETPVVLGPAIYYGHTRIYFFIP